MRVLHATLPIAAGHIADIHSNVPPAAGDTILLVCRAGRAEAFAVVAGLVKAADTFLA